VGFPPVFLTLRKVIQGGLSMRFSKRVLLKLKPAFDQTVEKPAVGFLESLGFHRDQRVEKVKADCFYLVHGESS
jgi:hypothetical protein